MLKLISFLDSITPFIQVFDCLLMILCGIICLKAPKRGGLTTLAIACFLSAVILLGFFLSATPNDKPLFALSVETRSVFYLTARLLAPFELLLFAIAIVLVARGTVAEKSK